MERLEAAQFETHLEVGMTCEGCAAAVKRLLMKINGVTNVDANVGTKAVIITSTQSIAPDVYLTQLENVRSIRSIR